MIARIIFALLSATLGAAVATAFTAVIAAAAFLCGVNVGGNLESETETENTETE